MHSVFFFLAYRPYRIPNSESRHHLIILHPAIITTQHTANPKFSTPMANSRHPTYNSVSGWSYTRPRFRVRYSCPLSVIRSRVATRSLHVSLISLALLLLSSHPHPHLPHEILLSSHPPTLPQNTPPSTTQALDSPLPSPTLANGYGVGGKKGLFGISGLGIGWGLGLGEGVLERWGIRTGSGLGSAPALTPSGESGPARMKRTKSMAATATTTQPRPHANGYPLSTLIVVALIAFLMGSLLRSLISPADFIYVMPDSELSAGMGGEEGGAGWREIRRLVEVKYLVGGWDFQVAVVRRH